MAEIDIATQQYLRKIENAQDELLQMQAQFQKNLQGLQNTVKNVDASMIALRNEFNAFCKEQAKEHAIDRATTEIVRVRQELDQKFSNYSVVRETMLGVLQATDLALVKKDTISRVSEELMLSTPEYWLAPCLVAVAAWIGNNRDLATRAIREAVKRDEAKTALTMALICRRNGRQDTCYEWLSIYFAHQDSGNFSEATLLYIDAYVNGVFGKDEKHICDDYINKWMNEVRGNSANFEADQEKIWKEYCAGFAYDVSTQFPDLSGYVKEYPEIDAYIGRINSVGDISENFANITTAVVSQESLKENIDKRLILLISKYDTKEEALKREEHYYDLVRKLGGDEQTAMQVVAREEQAKREHTLNLVEQMSNVVVMTDDVPPSMKKTAVTFLSDYIQKGFDSYIAEKKENFPKQITVGVYDWSGTVVDGSEAEALCADFTNHMMRNKDTALYDAAFKPTRLYTGVCIAAVIALIALIMGIVGLTVLSVAGGLVWTMYNLAQKGKAEEQQQQIAEEYTRQIVNGQNTIRNICSQWRAAQDVVRNFENTPSRRIVG